ncbi:MAG: alpha/beta hydrolase [Pseudomonadota bacterium]
MYVTVNGAKLFFDVEGAEYVADGAVLRRKPTVVLLHGGPGADHAVYKPAFSALSDVAQVIYYDHRGNGRSGGDDPADWTLAQWGDDVRGLCDSLGIENPIIIGVSFGGFVAQAYAIRHLGHAKALALISTAALFDFDAMYKAFGRRGGPEAEASARNYWSNPTVETRMAYHEACLPLYTVHQNDPDLFARVLLRNEVALHFNGPKNEQGAMDFRAALAGVDCPTLVMVGEDDPVTPPEFSEAIVDALPNGAEFVCYDACGHGVTGDRPEEAFAVLKTFIARNA